MRHISTPDDKTNQKLFILHKQFVKCISIPFMLQPKENSLQQSIPFYVDLVYILVHFPRFSFINFVVLNAEKSSSLHTITLKNKTQTKYLIILIFNRAYFLPRKIRYFIPFAINTHIDCANSSKCSVRYILKATARSLESVLLEHFLLD